MIKNENFIYINEKFTKNKLYFFWKVIKIAKNKLIILFNLFKNIIIIFIYSLVTKYDIN